MTDLLDVDLVHLLDGGADLGLVGVNVNNKDQGVVVLDLLHGGLGGQGELDDGEGVQSWGRGRGLGRALWRAGQAEGGGALEVDRGADLLLAKVVLALQRGLGGCFSRWHLY